MKNFEINHLQDIVKYYVKVYFLYIYLYYKSLGSSQNFEMIIIVFFVLIGIYQVNAINSLNVLFFWSKYSGCLNKKIIKR